MEKVTQFLDSRLACTAPTEQLAAKAMDRLPAYLSRLLFGKSHERIFFQQLKGLKSCGYPPGVLNRLEPQLPRVIEMAAGLGRKRLGCMPFIPVVPFKTLSVYVQLRSLGTSLDESRAQFDSSLFYDDPAQDFPDLPYYLFGVDAGENFSNTPWSEAGLTINESGRLCLTLAEIIALEFHYRILERHCLVALGTFSGHGPAADWAFLRPHLDSMQVSSGREGKHDGSYGVPSAIKRRCFLLNP